MTRRGRYYLGNLQKICNIVGQELKILQVYKNDEPRY